MPMLSQSLEELSDKQQADGTSLGLIRPARVTDFAAEPEARDWEPRRRAKLAQLRLFGPERKPLTKLPYTFRYHFECADARCSGHKLMVEDWEVGALYLNALDRNGGDECAAIGDVRRRFLGDLCSARRDTLFLVGNTIGHPRSWLVLGVFWPPASPSLTLPLNGTD